MSKQINCSVVGKATDTPTLVVDNGHPYTGVFENSTRVIFTIPDTEMPWGANIVFGGQSIRLYCYNGPIAPENRIDHVPFNPGAYEGPVLTYAPATPDLVEVQVVGDHFEVAGRRWFWRMTTGFCDYKLFLDGGDLRSLLKQNQDLGAKGRRVLPHIVNIVDFNPDAYGQTYWDRLPEYLSINAEYEQYVDFPVLSDTGYRGWNLGKCQDFWAHFVDIVKPSANRFVNLTNEFDHGGNLVGNPNDYARPSGMVVSQGSAVQDSTPPSPGWDYREWHAADDPTHFSHEYYIWKGLSTGGTPKPTVITEMRRLDENNADADYVRTLTYASLANGQGLTVHTDDGKFSRIVGPNQAACIKTAMDVLAAAV